MEFELPKCGVFGLPKCGVFGLPKCGVLIMKRGKVVKKEGISMPDGKI